MSPPKEGGALPRSLISFAENPVPLLLAVLALFLIFILFPVLIAVLTPLRVASADLGNRVHFYTCEESTRLTWSESLPK